MLNPSELKAWCCRLNLNEPAQNLIDHIRSSEPARRVGGGGYAMEHDPLTLEFYVSFRQACMTSPGEN